MLAMDRSPQRIVILLPNPLGDAVMFTPALRAIRAKFGQAELVLLGRPGPAALLTPNPWTDRVIAAGGFRAAVRTLRSGRFDLAVLGANSFRSALTAALGGASRRLGYDRDGRGWLLTDRLKPPRDDRGRIAVPPAIDYYLALAAALGADASDRRMELGVDDSDAATAEQLLAGAGLDPARPLVMLNPGASFGPAKMYPPELFAAVGDALVRSRGAHIVINAAPGEVAIAQSVEEAMAEPVLVNLARVGSTLGLLKALVKRSALLVTNDTGPRHFAAALGVPVVTIFGPTDPDRTRIYYDKERPIRADVPCSPCQKKRCPLPPGRERLRCMLQIPPETVVAAAEQLLDQGGTS